MYPIRVNRDYLDPHFMAWLLVSDGFTEYADEESRRARMPKLNRDQLFAWQTPLPPLAEQKRIAGILKEQMAAVERARRSAKAQLQAAESLPAAYLRAVFHSPEAQAWPRKKLGEVSAITSGVQKCPEGAAVKHHRPYLTVRNVQRGFLDLTHVDRFEVTEAELTRLRLQPGDLLIVEGNRSLEHIGRNALFLGDGQEWIHQNHIIRVRLRHDVLLPEFVSRFLNSDMGRAQMVEKAKTTSGLYTLSAGKVAELETPLCSLAHQHRIAAQLSGQVASAERLRQALAEQLDAINTLPAALLREAFSGRL